MALYVTDTHPLLWYAAGQHYKLSKTALRLFKEAEEDEGLIFIPVIALWEISLLIKKRRFQLLQPFNQWSKMLLAKAGFDLAPLQPEAIGEAMHFNFNNDLFDAVIVATAMIKNLPLITKDQDIVDAQIVEVIW